MVEPAFLSDARSANDPLSVLRLLFTAKSSTHASRQVTSMALTNHVLLNMWQLLFTIQTSEIPSILSKYRYATKILKGASSGQNFVTRDVMPAFPKSDDPSVADRGRTAEASGGTRLDNGLGEVGDESVMTDDAHNDNTMLGILVDDVFTPFDPLPPSPQGKRRCSGRLVDDPFGFDCNTLSLNRTSIERGAVGRDSNAERRSNPGARLSDHRPMPPGGSKKDARMPLTDFVVGNWDLVYYGSLKFGLPPQELLVDIDTGSADLWIPVQCTDCNNEQLKPELSPTYQATNQEFRASYGSGWAEGVVASDSVGIDKLLVRGQYFGAVNYVSDEIRGSPASGLLGLAFGAISVMRQPTFFEGLILSGQLKYPTFGVHLTREKKEGSELCLGCVDEAKFRGQIYWVPLQSKTYWAVSMTGFSVDGEIIQNTTLTAAIDTGSTLVYLPMRVARLFYSQIPGARLAEQYDGGFWTYPCSAQLNVSFQFHPHTTLLAIHNWDFNLGRVGTESDQCMGGVLGLPDGFPDDFAVIGDEFLKSWYSIYDYGDNGRVGFASSINNN